MLTRENSTSTLGSKASTRLRGFSMSRKKQPRSKTVDLCHGTQLNLTPAVGGIEVEQEHLDRYPLLPPYVVLFEPTQEDIWLNSKQRSIFLNQPLTASEQQAMTRFRQLLLQTLQLGPDEDLPRWLVPHMTRLLQQTKYKPDPAVHLHEILFTCRVQKLPITFDMVKENLKLGFVYWHGRDVRCKPILTLRLIRGAPLFGKNEEVERLFLFNMEFCVRHLMVPGRVESWVVLIDCAGIDKANFSMWKAKEFSQTIATTLGKLYSGRMTWIKIFNFPSSLMYKSLRMFIESIVRALGKDDKVSFVADAKKELTGKVDMGQIEQWAGGDAPDLRPEEVYPYRMFATPKGYGDKDAAGTVSFTNDAGLKFHEGYLFADCLQNQTSWRTEAASEVPLTPQAAQELGVTPCRDLDSWRRIMGSELPKVMSPIASADNADDIAEPVVETSPVPQPVINRGSRAVTENLDLYGGSADLDGRGYEVEVVKDAWRSDVGAPEKPDASLAPVPPSARSGPGEIDNAAVVKAAEAEVYERLPDNQNAAKDKLLPDINIDVGSVQDRPAATRWWQCNCGTFT
eukprot:TRINITY_DN7940_c0_g1_i1.p1 TRINITY_DN7940_c0_g1~~TRINITY_DN7940_c0_g1_i1.p1  ORF type:complete len:570 (-),score=96.18 TRINITY_DN7940_c0_g1_i1:226-1935(-)